VAKQNIAVVGAGIVGLAHAWSAAQRGHRVTIFERSPRASGASIRNFGMIWPIGQPAGPCRDVALESHERWLQLQAATGIWIQRCGSIHLAHRPDEWAVLQEFEAHSARLGCEFKLLAAKEVQAHTPAANPAGLIGGLFSPLELCVNPRRAVSEMGRWLTHRFDVRGVFGTEVKDVSEHGSGLLTVETASGSRENFDRVVICGGAELQTLFPDLFAKQALKLCKLQMLKTAPQASGWKLGPHLAGGLTLRHYQNFQACPSLAALRERIARETPELDRYGIHVMAAQNDMGEIVLGDSHEYGDDIEPFDKTEIDNLIVRELKKIIRLPDWTIAERWHGVYAKNPASPCFEAEPLPNVHVCTATGGAGMTMAFGIAERAWKRWTPSS
jgi:D-hydroxyproline dehydrogenase subunit beta